MTYETKDRMATIALLTLLILLISHLDYRLARFDQKIEPLYFAMMEVQFGLMLWVMIELWRSRRCTRKI